MTRLSFQIDSEDIDVELLGWILLTAGIVAALTAGAARWTMGRREAAPPADVPHETGLIQTLPAGAPPPDARPGMLGLLDDDEVGARELMVTLLDLAGRGLVAITPVTDPGTQPPRVIDWTLRRTAREAEGLHQYEATLLDGALDRAQGPVAQTLSGLVVANRPLLDRALALLRGTDREAGWTTAPRHRSAWGVLGGIILLAGLAGIAVSLMRAMTLHVPWLGIVGGILLAGAGVLFVGLARLRPGRTAAGDAAAHQIERYRDWLQHVAAHEIRLEEANDVLNRNLAAALAVHAETHLAEAFDQLARRAAGWDRPVTITPAWLTEPGGLWTPDSPPHQLVALAQQFVADGERAADRAGVGLATGDADQPAKAVHPLPKR